MTDCIFCKIIKQEIPTKFLYQDKIVVAFYDTHPMTPVHVLIIPKKHIPSIADFRKSHEKLAGRMLMVAKQIAENLQIAENGYKLLIRVRKHGGQEIDHLHLHLLGGAPLAENIRPL